MKDHEPFMRIALAEAEAALKAGDFPVGCVLVRDDRVLARGRRTNSGGVRANELDHAEVTTLRRLLAEQPQTDCSLITAYSTMEPCLMCYATLLLSGIRRFIWAYEDVMGGGTDVPLEQLNELYTTMRVDLTPGVLRRESLDLFQNFFRLHTYWQDSLLARYTINQPLEQKG